MRIEPITLTGRALRLEPLAFAHQEELCRAALHESVARWMTFPLATSEDVEKFIAEALAAQEVGTALPFATIEQSSGTVVGSTRYGNIDRANRRVEIGWTLIAPEWQRTAVNTEAKYLMLRYAFEEFGCMRVEFKTDALNTRSREAILRLGAHEEGIFRKHMLAREGRVRDSVYYSIVDSEWPKVKAGLEAKLAQGKKSSS